MPELFAICVQEWLGDANFLTVGAAEVNPAKRYQRENVSGSITVETSKFSYTVLHDKDLDS